MFATVKLIGMSWRVTQTHTSRNRERFPIQPFNDLIIPSHTLKKHMRTYVRTYVHECECY